MYSTPIASPCVLIVYVSPNSLVHTRAVNLQDLSGGLLAFNKLTRIDLSGLGLTGAKNTLYPTSFCHIYRSLHTGAFPDQLYQRLFSFEFFNFKGNDFDVDKNTIKGVFITEFTNIKDQTNIDLCYRDLTGSSKTEVH